MLLEDKTYYYTKGYYYLLSDKLDSALFFFRKEVAEATTTNNRESGYLGLSRYFARVHQPDSAVKYALLSRSMNDSCQNELSTEFYQRMQSQYNYNQSLLKSATLEKENLRFRLLLILLLSSSLFVITLVVYWGRTLHLKREKVKEDLKLWRERHAQLMQLNSELEMLRHTENEAKQIEIDDKQEQIDFLVSRLKDMEKKMRLRNLLKQEAALLESDTVTAIRNLKDAPSHEQWQNLKHHLNRAMPDFLPSLKMRYPSIREEELRICILLRLHIPLKQIAVLCNISLQNLNNTRRRLLLKVFGVEGNAKDFDINIQNLE